MHVQLSRLLHAQFSLLLHAQLSRLLHAHCSATVAALVVSSILLRELSYILSAICYLPRWSWQVWYFVKYIFINFQRISRCSHTVKWRYCRFTEYYRHFTTPCTKNLIASTNGSLSSFYYFYVLSRYWYLSLIKFFIIYVSSSFNSNRTWQRPKYFQFRAYFDTHVWSTAISL